MKKISFTLILCVLFSFIALCQPYSETQYNRQGYFMSSGSICTASAGMVMAGYQPSSTGANFAIDRSDVGFTFTGGSWQFGNLYDLNYVSGNCSGTPGTGNNCVGVSIIETAITGSAAEYAIAGTFDEGVFFATLDISGIIISDALYRFPSGAFSASKPTLVESSVGEQYFICGSYSMTTVGNVMYVIKVNSTGSILHSRTYNVVSGVEIFPKDMILSPYTPSGANELIITGRVQHVSYNIAFQSKPFFMRLKQSDITSLSFNYYGQVSNGANYMVEGFSAITVANFVSGGSNGFVCAGYSDSIADYPVWMVKLTSTGQPNWSNFYKPWSDNSQHVEVMDVIERPSSAYNYNYFALTTSTVGMMVLKFDKNGDRFVPGVPIDDKNEFIFQPNAGQIAQPSSISYLDNGGGNDQGIHVFGTYAGTGQYYLIEAPFNGVELGTCNLSYTTNILFQANGPMRTSTVGVNTMTGLSRCNTFSIISNASNPVITASCVSNSLPTQGSLAKGITNTLENRTEPNTLFKLFPNPTKDKLIIEINTKVNSKLKIDLYDVVGRFISVLIVPETVNSGKHSFEIDLSNLSLENGIYFINTLINTTQHKEKIIYSHE